MNEGDRGERCYCGCETPIRTCSRRGEADAIASLVLLCCLQVALQSPIPFRSHLPLERAQFALSKPRGITLLSVCIMSNTQPTFRGAGFTPALPKPAAGGFLPPAPTPAAGAAPKAPDKAPMPSTKEVKMDATAQLNEGGMEDLKLWVAKHAGSVKGLESSGAASPSSPPQEPEVNINKKVAKRHRQKAKLLLAELHKREPME